MKTVKLLLFVVLIMGLLIVTSAMALEKESQTAGPGPTTAYEGKLPIALQAGEYELKTLIIDFPQGAGMSTHMHGGYVVVTVLNGEITLRDKGGERIVKAGEGWTENPGDHHSVMNAGTIPARVAGSMLLPKGAEATTIIK